MSSSRFRLLWGAFNPGTLARSLWRHRDLAWQFTIRNIELRHRGSRLGHLWALINPLSSMVLYLVVFGLFFGTTFGVLPKETKFDYGLALFLGLSLFHVFGEIIAISPMLIVTNPNFVKKVVFPLEILPVAQIGAATFHLGMSLALILIASLFSTAGLGWSTLWLPVVVLPYLLLALGLAWGLAALGVFLRDIGQLAAFLSTAIMFASAVAFPPSRIWNVSEKLWLVLRLNPLLQMHDLARRVVLWHQPMPWSRLAYVYVCAIAVLLVGNALFNLLRRAFAEVL